MVRPLARAAAIVSVATMFVVSVAPSGRASSKGPFPGFTGAPGEQTCRHCHDNFPLNMPGGELTIGGFPDVYVPGETYSITVGLASDSAFDWGFQATVLTSNAKRAGKFIVTDPEHTKAVKGIFDTERRYIEQKEAGHYDDVRWAVSWTFDWRAPKKDKGPVTIYVAGNAGNDNGQPTGDLIYYREATAQSPASLATAR
jgi:hypothetical protein